MGQGSYVFCEWDSVRKTNSDFQLALKALDDQIIQKCSREWAPRAFGGLNPQGNEFGRTSILPEIFDNSLGANLIHYRQRLLAAGNQILLQGNGTGAVLPEDIKVAWAGLAFPNEQMNITEIRFQIGDKKYGRINIEELANYDKPALVFEEGFILDEEQSFDLWGYVREPDFQRIVPLGAMYYKYIDKVLGTVGAAIT